MVDRDKLLTRDHVWHQDDLKLQRSIANYSLWAAIAQGASAVVAAIAIVAGIGVAIYLANDDSPRPVYVVTPSISQQLPTPESP